MTRIPHRSVAEALERLAGQVMIADDGPHVAFVIGVNIGDPPSLWVCDRQGDVVPFDHVRNATDRPDPTAPSTETGRAAPWTPGDLAEASALVHDLLIAWQHTNDPEQALDQARRMYRRRRDAEFDHQLAVDLERSRLPHQCSRCGRRWATELDRDRHEAACRQPCRHQPAYQWIAYGRQHAVRCVCGHVIHAPTATDAGRAMLAHAHACRLDDPV
ncbi:hypothetical protein [Desertimonas flava]|uniref:hypothetical protein n=1 Tax=Desertimonas flava TaxID=2064846 RepID=UPI000E3555B4|nr:hypothetical protein [Desertimonas flava]